MDSCDDTRRRVGCPIRRSTDQRLLAAPRGFSQRATSFIASWCQGIHRMPLLYSILRTAALRDTSRSAAVHHARKPSPESVVSAPSAVVEDNSCRRQRLSAPATAAGSFRENIHLVRTQQDFARPLRCRSLTRPRTADPAKSFTAPLNPRRSAVGDAIPADGIARSDSRLVGGSRFRPADRTRLARAQRRTRT